MAEAPETNGDNVAPRTPPRRNSPATRPNDSASPFTRANNTTTTTDKRAPTPAKDPAPPTPSTPAAPFLAYARRTRSFSSPFHPTRKTRYLLTFDSATTASTWTTLVRTHYPDTTRESPQLFSFKSEGVPARAFADPRFEDLRGKWSYRLLDDEVEDKAGRAGVRGGDRRAESAKRVGVGRSPSLSVLREDGTSPELVRDTALLDDPFTPNAPQSAQGKAQVAQLNITSERIHKAVRDSGAGIEALVEGQQGSARAMLHLLAGVEKMGLQVEGVAQAIMGSEVVVQEVQKTVAQSAVDLRSLVDRPLIHDPMDGETLVKLQEEVAQNSAQMKVLLEGQKTARKNVNKMQTMLEQQALTQKLLVEQTQTIQLANMQNQALITSLAVSQDARFERLMAAFEQHTAQTRDTMLAQQGTINSSRREVLAAVKEGAPVCNHDIIPPPRKMNKKLVGYVYARNGS